MQNILRYSYHNKIPAVSEDDYGICIFIKHTTTTKCFVLGLLQDEMMEDLKHININVSIINIINYINIILINIIININ